MEFLKSRLGRGDVAVVVETSGGEEGGKGGGMGLDQGEGGGKGGGGPNVSKMQQDIELVLAALVYFRRSIYIYIYSCL